MPQPGPDWTVCRNSPTATGSRCAQWWTLLASELHLRELFRDLGWVCEHAYPRQQTSPTPWGDIFFNDGVQIWKNPG